MLRIKFWSPGSPNGTQVALGLRRITVPLRTKIDPAQPAPNVSVPQVFTPGQPRYFELLAKEGGGGDNLAMIINPELSATPAPPDGTAPDQAYFEALGFGFGVYADDVPRVISGPRLKTGSAVAGQETIFTAVYYAPPGHDVLSMVQKWHRDRGRYLRGIHVHAGRG